MLTLYRRHKTNCPKRQDRYWKRCDCPMWTEGTLERKYIRQSLRTLSWERAKQIVSEWEKSGSAAAKTGAPTIHDASAEYISDCRAHKFADITIAHHENWLKHFGTWCQSNNYRTINELDTAALEAWFVENSALMSTTLATYRKRFKAWFKFCIRRKWIQENPVADLSRLIVRQTPTDYFRPAEIKEILECAVDAHLHAWIGLARYSGLRITDALHTGPERIEDSMVMITQRKTGEPVRVLLPPFLVDELAKLELSSPGRYFVKPGENWIVCGNRYRRMFARALKKTKIERRGHPHMLRDTFAIENLLAGVPLEFVSKMLGHKSIKTTERHYAPWVRARQEQMTEAIRRSWV